MENTNKTFHGPVVSSAHLATGAMPALSEFEFASIMISHAFDRWIVPHTVFRRGKAKRMADICRVLNIEDTHVEMPSMSVDLMTDAVKNAIRTALAVDKDTLEPAFNY